MDSYDDDDILLVLTDPSITDNEALVHEKASKLMSDAQGHNLVMNIQSSSIEVLTSRRRLVEQSSYFRGLLDGTFCESHRKLIPVHWDLEPFIHVLQFIHGCALNMTWNNFAPLLEAALYFGVEKLLLECEAWFQNLSSGSQKVPAETIIEMWNFGIENGLSYLRDTSEAYLARNFAWASMSCSFCEIPYDLLYSCVRHPELTVDSEKQLCQALVTWLLKNVKSFHCSSSNSKFDILSKVRVNLLPLEFVTGLRRHIPQFAVEAVNKILNLLEDSSSILQQITDEKVDDSRIRLTKFSEKVVLSSCIQITTALLFMAIIPSDFNLASEKKLVHALLELDRRRANLFQVPEMPMRTLSFESVHSVDISKCPKLHFGGFVKWLQLAFSSLKVLKASHCMPMKMEDVFCLLRKCQNLTEVDITVDISLIVSTEVSVMSETTEPYRLSDGHGYEIPEEPLLKPYLSNISKLTLEGRSEISDVDLLKISSLSNSLSYLNIKGCTRVTDMGISKLLSKSPNIHSLILSYTSVGAISVSTLCSIHASPDAFHEGADEKYSKTMAYRLQELQIDGCKGLDQILISQLLGQAYMLKILSLRQITVADSALGYFRGLALECLDVSETLVSMEALMHLVKKNVGIKTLRATGCRYLHPLNSSNVVPCGSATFGEHFFELNGSCFLEEIAFGWGFPFISEKSLEHLTELRRISFGLGASPGHHILLALPQICPLLESVVLTFQGISDSIVRNFMELKNLRILELSCCHGNLSAISFQITMVMLRVLKLAWVTHWMTNDDLTILTENCPNIRELSLSGCKLLDSDSQEIIAHRCPGLILLHLEECGKITSNGITSLFNCKAIEALLLRHNGKGIGRKIVFDAVAKLPLLRRLSLDLCDACDGGFDSPSHYDRCFITSLRISRCKSQQCGFDMKKMEAFRPVHKETIVLEWNNKELRTTVIEERV